MCQAGEDRVTSLGFDWCPQNSVHLTTGERGERTSAGQRRRQHHEMSSINILFVNISNVFSGSKTLTDRFSGWLWQKKFNVRREVWRWVPVAREERYYQVAHCILWWSPPSPPSSSPRPGLPGHTTVPACPPSCPPNIPPSFCSSSLWALLVVYCSTLVKLMFGSLYLEQFKGFWVTQNGGDNWVTFSLLFWHNNFLLPVNK